MSTQGLVKHYGRIHALRGVTLEVAPGEIFGLLGQNGAGKTTLIKILLGITKPTDGDANLARRAGRQRPSSAGASATCPRTTASPTTTPATACSTSTAPCSGVGRSDRRQRIPEMLELVGLKGRMHYKIRTYSKGMKQRLGIAQALIHDPEVIFLDEPTDGVDPVGRREIRDLHAAARRRRARRSSSTRTCSARWS